MAKTNKVALITGCSEPQSLGAALATELNRRGYRVFATARNIHTMDHLRALGCDVLQLDVTNHDSIAEAAQTVAAEAGRLDLLVNNAGVHAFSPALDTDLNAMRRVLEVNTIAPLAVTQAFAPLLIKTGSLATEPTTAPAKARAKPLPPPPAVVLNIGSAAVAGVPFMGVYGASKAALQTLSDTMRREMAALGVRVVTLELGSVRTAMSSGDKTQDLARTDRLWGFYPNIKAIRASVERLMIATVDAAPTAEIVARQIVDAVASKNPPPKLWLGNPSTLSRWVYPFLPIWVLDYLYDKYAGGNLVMHPTETPQHESAAEGALTGDSAAHN